MRNGAKPVRPSFYRCARAVTVAGLAAPLLIAATSVNIASAQAVSPRPPADRDASAEPLANQDRGEIAGWFGLGTGTCFVIAASRRRRRFAAA